MNQEARDFANTLTEKQEKAFRALLEKTLRESGYYARNVKSNQLSNQLYNEGQKKYAQEFDAVTNTYREVMAQIEQEREALRQREVEAYTALESARALINQKIWDETKEQRDAIWAERGDTRAEEEAIERLVIAQYQKRLDKRAKVEA